MKERIYYDIGLANTDDMHVCKLVLSTLGIPALALDALRWEDVVVYTPDQFVNNAWREAEKHFLKEYHKKHGKFALHKMTNDKSVTKEMLEEYWLENYGVPDIEELRTDIRKVKLADSEVLTRYDGMDFVVHWVGVKSNE